MECKTLSYLQVIMNSKCLSLVLSYESLSLSESLSVCNELVVESKSIVNSNKGMNKIYFLITMRYLFLTPSLNPVI